MNGEETNLVRRITLAVAKYGVRLFRNNVGTGWIGRSKQFTKTEVIHVNRGDVIIYQGRIFHAGLIKGSGDSIGLTPVVITPQMVGKTVAVFTSIESKTAKGVVSPEQKNWVKFVQDNGGIAGIAKSEEDAEKIISAYNGNQ